MANVLNRTTCQYITSAHTPNYDPADWIINPDLAAVSGVPKKYWKITGDTVSEMDQAEKDAVDDTDLPAYKTDKFAAIDAKTVELITAGYAFAGKQFSLSIPAQTKLMGINQVRTDPAVVYPIRWNTIDDTDHYDIPDAATVLNFYLTAVGTYRGHVDSGTALKDSVRAATTQAEVDAVVDNR